MTSHSTMGWAGEGRAPATAAHGQSCFTPPREAKERRDAGGGGVGGYVALAQFLPRHRRSMEVDDLPVRPPLGEHERNPTSGADWLAIPYSRHCVETAHDHRRI
jgi:hypothetical protein